MASLEQLADELERSYAELQERMADPSVYADRREAAELGRRLKELEPAVRAARDWRQASADLAEAQGRTWLLSADGRLVHATADGLELAWPESLRGGRIGLVSYAVDGTTVLLTPDGAPGPTLDGVPAFVSVDDGSGCVAPSSETIQDGSYTPLSRPLFMYPSAEAMSTAWLVANRSVPALPGATCSAVTSGSFDSPTSSACSRPPDPITSVRTGPDSTRTAA